MATAVLNPQVTDTEPTLRERVVDTARRVAHVSHEARMLTSIASDAVDERAYRARRAAKQARRGLDDARDEMVHRIKQEAMKAIGLALGAGLCLGAVTGLLAWLTARRTHT